MRIFIQIQILQLTLSRVPLPGGEGVPSVAVAANVGAATLIGKCDVLLNVLRLPKGQGVY